MLYDKDPDSLPKVHGIPSVSGRGAVRDPQEARGSSQDLPPKGHDRRRCRGGHSSYRFDTWLVEIARLRRSVSSGSVCSSVMVWLVLISAVSWLFKQSHAYQFHFVRGEPMKWLKDRLS